MLVTYVSFNIWTFTVVDRHGVGTLFVCYRLLENIFCSVFGPDAGDGSASRRDAPNMAREKMNTVGKLNLNHVRIGSRHDSNPLSSTTCSKTRKMESTAPVSLTSLLNSLHTHLQQQTQLLPALHSQLGLPHTSLADELSALEQELTACVERQIDLRRKQVDQWMDKCAAVENDCARYSKALGGHIKVVGSGIGELKKEHVLPKRYDALAVHQERLRQVSTPASVCQIAMELTMH